MILEVKQGDLLDATESHLIQQCNCYTVKSHGLSAQIARRFPKADVYKHRPAIRGRNCTSEPSVPGTIQVDWCGRLSVVHLFAQVYPGKSGQYDRIYGGGAYPDTPMHRIRYFKACLELLDEEVTYAAPNGIGCGLAGGNWKVYEAILHASKVKFVLYRI
jgi:hypothetical protein